MENYRFLLNQHIGKPSVPKVKKGSMVNRGEIIAIKAIEAIGSNVHSSINGKVINVTDEYIEIEKKGQHSASKYMKLKAKTPLKLIEEAGIVGLGGAGFPTYVKLAKPLQKGGTVIINAAECEPILTHNILRIEKSAEKVMRGIKIVMKIVNATYGKIAIKEKHKAAIEALKKCIDGNIQICLLPDMYPMGEERALIRQVEGILLDVGSIPFVSNIIVINVETVYRIYEAVEEKKPLMDKDITMAGKLMGDLIQVFEDVPIGMRVQELVDKAGGCNKEYGEIIMGGPFTGKRISMDFPVMKTTGGIILTETFLKGPDTIGILVCACGADENRLMQIAQDMGSRVLKIEYCKQAIKVKGVHKCENPGICPGQAEKVMELKKSGVRGLLISNCSDCTNTVMSCAPKFKLPVYHCTDGALRAVNHKLIRKLNVF